MARVNIDKGIVSFIRRILNNMFTELYNKVNGVSDMGDIRASSLTLTGATPLTFEDTVYDDLQVSISTARLPTANTPTWENITLDGYTTKLLAFDTDDYVTLLIQTTHSTKLNTIIDNHIHWTLSSDDDGDEIQFQITGVGGGIGESFSSIGTIKSGDLVLSGNAGKHNLLDIGNIPSTNSTVSSCFIIDLKRIAPDDGNDSTELVYVIFNDCHVKIDTIGSAEETSKV